MANTFHQYFKDAVRTKVLYMLDNYDVEAYAVMKDQSDIKSNIARIRNQFMIALNAEHLLPKIIDVILDDDVVRRTHIEEEGLSLVLKNLIDWLFNSVEEMIQEKKRYLPSKSVRATHPMIYWVESPQHVNFTNNLARRKFNSTVQATAAIHRSMKIIRMKKEWNPDDKSLFADNRYSSEGLMKYWDSVDSAVEFNDTMFKKKNQNFIPFESRNTGFRRRDRYQWVKKTESRFKLPDPGRRFNQN